MTAKNVSRSSALSAGSAVCATLAALALAACGPRDAAEPGPLVGGAPATQGETATPAATQAQGTPVPAPYPARPGGTHYEAQPSYVPGPDQQRVAESAPVVARASIGSVESIEPIHVRPQGTGAGAVIGGVLGAVVGNQFGHGGGRGAMTGLGAVGGAVAGNNIERNQREAITAYRVRIHLDNGRTRVFERWHLADLRVGDRVRVDASSFHRV
jgi:outer membrane lipoprotein SlyB